jgi:hypothetical protein
MNIITPANANGAGNTYDDLFLAAGTLSFIKKGTTITT